MDTVKGYEPLAAVLTEAYEQAYVGKGSSRHALSGQSWLQQQWVSLADTYGDGFLLGQAAKKTNESQGMEDEAAYHELLGAINYLSMAAYRRKPAATAALTTQFKSNVVYRSLDG